MFMEMPKNVWRNAITVFTEGFIDSCSAELLSFGITEYVFAAIVILAGLVAGQSIDDFFVYNNNTLLLSFPLGDFNLSCGYIDIIIF